MGEQYLPSLLPAVSKRIGIIGPGCTIAHFRTNFPQQAKLRTSNKNQVKDIQGLRNNQLRFQCSLPPTSFSFRLQMTSQTPGSNTLSGPWHIRPCRAASTIITACTILPAISQQKSRSE